MGDGVGSNIESDLGLFSVQKEGELVLERREVDHEEGFDGDLEFASRAVESLNNVKAQCYHIRNP